MALLALSLLAAGLLAWGLFLNQNVLERAERQLKAAGYPTHYEELLSRLPQPPPELNAAIPFQAAFPLLVARETNLPLVGFGKLNRGERLGAAQLSQFQAAFQSNQAVFPLLYEGARRPQATYHFPLVKRELQFSPVLTGSQQSARLLHARTYVAAQLGDRDEALRALEALLALGNSLDMPILIISLVQCRVYDRGLNALQDALSLATFTERELLFLDTLLAAVELKLAQEDFFGGEAAVIFETFRATDFKDLPDLAEDESWYDRFRFRVALLTGSIKQECLLLPNLLKGMEGAASKEGEHFFQWRAGYAAKCERQLKHRYFLRDTFPDFFIAAAQRRLGCKALVRAGRAGLAVERFRLSTGRLPESIDDLVPAYLPRRPKDPYDLAPLRYETEPGGYRLWAVGIDRTDDRGQVPARKTPNDVVFQVVH